MIKAEGSFAGYGEGKMFLKNPPPQQKEKTSWICNTDLKYAMNKLNQLLNQIWKKKILFLK